MSLAYDCSTQLRGAWKISPGNVVNPTGTATSGGGWPAERAWALPCSQYHRAAEAPVPVSQYSVMLSTIRSRVRCPACCPSRRAREIVSYYSVAPDLVADRRVLRPPAVGDARDLLHLTD